MYRVNSATLYLLRLRWNNRQFDPDRESFGFSRAVSRSDLARSDLVASMRGLTAVFAPVGLGDQFSRFLLTRGSVTKRLKQEAVNEGHGAYSRSASAFPLHGIKLVRI